MTTKGKKIWNYFTMPEMRPFWIALAPLIFLIAADFYFFPGIWLWPAVVVSLAVLITMFYSGLASAKSRFNLLLERNQIRAIVTNFTEPIIAYSADFKVSAFNKASEEFFDLIAEEIVGQTVSPEWAKQEKTKILAQTIFPSLAPTMSWKSDPNSYPQIIDLSFSDPHLELTVTTVRIDDPLGGAAGFFKIIKDRTRQEELLTAKSEFLTVAAHQLRTPLAGIKWTFEAVINGDFGPINEEQKNALSDGLTATEKVSKTANDLLDAANIESGKFGYDFSENDLAGLIKKMIEGYQSLLEKHHLKAYFSVPENFPLFKFDIVKIRIVLQNLLENAIRYNVENGEISVKVEILDKFAQISVKDTGIGIPKDELPKLFNKFFRAQNVLKYETEGTGIGLYISKNIIEAHGGKIWAESIENRGSTFYFTLPLDENLIPRLKSASS